jgi:hypothetical protein
LLQIVDDFRELGGHVVQFGGILEKIGKFPSPVGVLSGVGLVLFDGLPAALADSQLVIRFGRWSG